MDELYSTFLDLRPGQTIVDLGCGTGDFTRYLAKLSGGKCRVTGIDIKEASLKAAETDTREDKSGNSITYKLGDAYKIPFESDRADLTCCRTLLIHLQDPIRAIREMTRVTKPGGLVAAVEPGMTSSFYDPEDLEYSDLSNEVTKAWATGAREIDGKDLMIGEKLPGIFLKAGLKNVMSEVQTDAWLDCDPRRKFGDVKKNLRFQYSIFKERKPAYRKYLGAGGLPPERIDLYLRRWQERTEMFLSNNDKLRNNPSISTASRVLVSGRKEPTQTRKLPLQPE
jgi:SAM-dependent methyltransferase